MARARFAVLRLGALALAVACTQPSSPASQHPAPPMQQLALYDLVGTWRWLYRTEEQGTSRVEEERWQLAADPKAPAQLVGRYVRSVEVHSLDRAPFQCNQRPSYRQRSTYDVVVELEGTDLVVKETAYATEPSPCDHGFRHLGDYHGKLAAGRLDLKWGPEVDAADERSAAKQGSSAPYDQGPSEGRQGTGSGTQTLWHVDDTRAPLATAPWPTTVAPTGTWRWDATSVDAVGNIQDETEWWEITQRTDTRLDATYRRRVTVRSADGTTPITCAGKPSWTYDDAYVLDGQKEEDHWHFHELAVEPGDHPCLRATPRRTLDEATAEQLGDYFILEWRGKRREILYRP